MDKIILFKELLLEIMEHCGDINDWIRFMFSSKNIYLHIYPEFIFKKFTFMVFEGQTLPLCIRNRNVIKYYYHNSSSNSYEYANYITTNENDILRHSQFNNVALYKTYGLFFQGLYLNDNGCPDINYVKILDLIDDNINNNIHNRNIFCNYHYLTNKKLHIKPLSIINAYDITERFIRTIDNKYYEENILNAKNHYYSYRKIIKDMRETCLINGNVMGFTLWSIKFKTSEPVTNKCKYCGEIYDDDVSEFHKNWFFIQHFETSKELYSKTHITPKIYKNDLYYHPINNKIYNL